MRSKSFKQSEAWEGIPLLRRSVIAVTVLALAVVGVVVPMSSAWAATGTISNAEISIVNDGNSGRVGDTSDTDGLVSLGNKVSFQWKVTLQDLTGGVLTQTLPEGFTWDNASLISAGLNNPDGANGYTSTYTLSPDGRTVTVNLSSTTGQTGVQILEFNTPTATVDRIQAQVGDVYTPELVIEDGQGTQNVTPQHAPSSVEVVGAPMADLTKTVRTSNPGGASTRDFGNGEEPAVHHTFRISMNKGTAAGQEPFEWVAPLRISDAYSLTQGGAPLTGVTQLIELGGKSSPTLVTSLEDVNTTNGSFTLVFDGNLSGNSIWVDVHIFIPKSEAPNTSDDEEPILIRNTVAKPADATWQTTNGVEISDLNSQNNMVERLYSYAEDTAAGSGASWASDFVDVNNLGTTRNGANVFSGAEYHHRLIYQPHGTRAVGETAWAATPTTGLNLFSFWNPLDSALVSTDIVRDGRGNTLVEGVDYRVWYTTDTGPGYDSVAPNADPFALNWTEQSVFTGDMASVRGVRYEYIGNGGTWQPDASATSTRMTDYRFLAYPKFKVIRESPNFAANPTDLGRVTNNGQIRSVIEYAAPTPTGGLSQNQVRELWVRDGAATVAKTGVVLTESGQVQQPSTIYLNAGQKVRYTITPRLTGNVGGPSPEDAESVIIPNVIVKDLLPANVILSSLDFSAVDPSVWSYEVTPNFNGNRAQITFRYLPEAHYADPLAPITFDVRTSAIAPTGSAFDNAASIRADNIFAANGGDAATTTFRMYASQLNVAQYEKTTDTPEVEIGGDARFNIQWYNYLSQTQGRSVFVDVLPYNGDPNGSTTDSVLKDATLSAHTRVGASLEITIDPTVRAGGMRLAPADGVQWISWDSATPEQIEAATALRVTLSDFVSGADSLGELSYTVTAPSAVNGSLLENTVNGALRLNVDPQNPVRLAEAAPAEVRYLAASVTGRVWEDTDSNGLQEAGESGLESVTVELLQGNVVVATTMTNGNGEYVFSSLTQGTYTVRVLNNTLPATEGDWVNTYSALDGENGVSGAVEVTVGSATSDIDFGYRNDVPTIPLPERPAITLVKEAVLSADGTTISYSFTAENTGNVTLNGVVLTDALPGLSDIELTWPGVVGTLAPGQALTGHATLRVTAAHAGTDVVNKATVSGISPQGTDVEATDSVVTTIPNLPPQNLSSTGAGPIGVPVAVSSILLLLGLLLLAPKRRRAEGSQG